MKEKKFYKLGQKVIKSIYVHNFLIMLAVIFIPLVLLSIFVYTIVESTVVGQKMARIETQNNILRNYILSENYMDSGESIIVDTELSQLSNVYNGRIEIINKNYKIIKDTFVTDEGKFCVTGSVLRALKGEQYSHFDSEKRYMEFAIPLVKVDGNDKRKNNVVGAILVFCQVEDIGDVKDKMVNFIFFFFSVMILVVIGVSVWLSMLEKKRYHKLTKAIDSLGNRDFDTKLNVVDNNEFMIISDKFNKTVESIKRLDESRSQFVSNVSHELKTPITSMKILADSLVGQDNLPIEIYQEFMTDIASEIDRENEIITDLLDMVKMDKKTATLNYSSVDIKELIEQVLKRLTPIASEKNIELVFESFRPVVADIDEVKFGRAISNLVENAIKYNVMDGWVRVTLNSDHKFFYITINDSGIGIPAENIDRIFDRFYRVDKARDRETGGSGLGLSIVKNIIILHEGEIKVYSKEEEGTTFSVRVPLRVLKENENIEDTGFIEIPEEEEDIYDEEEDM